MPGGADELGARGARAVAGTTPDRVAGEMLRVLTELLTAPSPREAMAIAKKL